MKKWKKLGQIYVPASKGRHPNLLTHAANPLPVHIEGDVYRIFYSSRDKQNRSSVGAVDIDILRRQIVCDHHEPFFLHGAPGTFYADGVSIGNCYAAQGVQYMLFMGWQAPATSHWRGDIGRLILLPDLTLQLDGTMPFMGTDLADPLSLSYPWVMESPSGGYDMWYGSTVTWDAGNNEMLHVINHAASPDGHNWNRTGLAIPYEIGKAQAFSRPTVVRNADDSYEMWFSYRGGNGDKYRIGQAKSNDGKRWVRSANAGIETSDSGWDCEMIEYPFVFDHDAQRYMLYNGNGYGKTGFGLAVMT